MLKIIALGGHLGSGKTTLLLKILERLRGKGLEVGALINDFGPVDFTFVASKAKSLVESISRSCLCVKGHELREALKRFVESKVDVILVEAIGFSDPYRVWATVKSNLSSINVSFELNPITVLIDGELLIKILKGSSSAFSPEIADEFEEWIAPEHAANAIKDIILQQLLEAELAIINKCDLISASSQNAIKEVANLLNPKAKIHMVSAITGHGVEALLSDLTRMRWSHIRRKTRPDIAKRRIDALLGMNWFNYEVYIKLPRKNTVKNLIEEMLKRLASEASRKGKGQIIRIKAYFESESSRVYASLTPDFRLSVDSYDEGMATKNGKLVVSIVVKNMEEGDVASALRESLSKISQKFTVSQI